MSEHPTIERISELLDEPWADLSAERHLEGCETCRKEFERLSRMRMAFSGLADLEPPENGWSRIEASLDEVLGPDARVAGIVDLTARQRTVARLTTRGPWQAAAAVALFASGVLAGLQFTGSSGPATPPAGPGADAALPSVIAADGEDRAVYDALTELESLRAPLRQAGLNDEMPESEAPSLDAYEAARLSARLDGLIRAMQERLDRSPDDALASAYLLEFTEARARLAEMLARSYERTKVVEW